MTDRWRTVEELFHGALAREPGEREAFLEEACADGELRAEVRSLLEADPRAGLLDDPAGLLGSVAMSVLPPIGGAWEEERRREGEGEPPLHVPSGVGPYRVLRQLGRGGMADVFLAERTDEGFRRRVALKLVRTGLGGEELTARFVAERALLARLIHPNIARLLDGGLTGEGLPWFAMEYVEGERLDRYCDERRLDVPARLRLFLAACDAVHYAHRHLVVHRDLKPANILVASDGTVKLLDFGIAKLLSPEVAGEASALSSGNDLETRVLPGAPPDATGAEPERGYDTRPEGRWLTPGYASPEQLRGEPVGTATDVYAIGVLLHELLTGRRPQWGGRFAGEGVRAEAASGRLDPLTAGITEAAARARATTPRRLRRRLAGDLEAIVLRALRDAPEERYATAGELADDLRRHLSARPVRARPDRFGYRASRFLRRHRVGAAAALLLLASLLAGSAATLWQASRARGEARVAALERDRARLEAAKAEEVAGFLLELFRLADPSHSRGETITVREVLDRGAARIEAEMSGQPELQATLMAVMGRVYASLGLYGSARRLLEGALDRQRRLHGDLHPDVGVTLTSLGRVFAEQSEYPAAERIYREALAIRRSLHGDEHPLVAASLFDLGRLLSETEEYEAARPLLEESLRIRRRALGEAHPDVAASLYEIALLVDRQGDHETARRLFREAVAVPREPPAEPNPAAAEQLAAAARVLHFGREYDAAEPLYRQALAMRRRLYHEAHPDLAASLNDLARVLRDIGNYEAAEPLARRALAMWRDLFPQDHREVGISLVVLANLLHEKGELEEAEALLREALAMRVRLLGPKHVSAVGARRTLADILVERGRPGEADPLYRRALADYRELHGDDHVYVAATLSGLGRIQEKGGDRSVADSLYRLALATARRSLRPGHPLLADHLLRLADLHAGEGGCTAEEPHYREALEVRRGGLPEGHWQVAEAASALGDCLARQGRHSEAEPLLLEALRIGEGRKGPAAPRLANLQRLASLYAAWGKPTEAARFAALAADRPAEP